jgi:hypothetical protein
VLFRSAKIGGGVVSNAEFATLDGIITGVSIQSQINGKQATGNYITSLTGDVTASGPGASAATLANSGVTAGTYNLLTVNTKGLATSGSITRWSYRTTVTQSSTTVAYAAIANLTSTTLQPGLYKFNLYAISQTSTTNTGIGYRVGAGTATISTISAKFRIGQAADGTAKDFVYDQLEANTNRTSASVAAANTNFNAIGEGVFRITAAGTVRIEFRTETNGNAATIQIDSVFQIELIA